MGREKARERRHPVPLKRRRRQIKVLIVTVAIGGALVAMLACGNDKEADEPRMETYLDEETTLHPQEVMATRAWTRYPVPLADDLQQYIEDTCAERGIDPSIVMAIIGVESKYDASAIGDHGNSYGLMQIYASVHEDRMARLGVTNLLDPRQNVTVGVDILAELMRWGNGLDYALSFYNGYGGAPCEYARIVQSDAQRLQAEAAVINEGVET